MFGYSSSVPKIKMISFPKGRIELLLSDGRIVICPLTKFPEIKKLSSKQRKNYNLLAGLGLMFENSGTVYHISDFLGKCNEVGISVNQTEHYISKVAEPAIKYKKYRLR
jgi:hypothetical protein